MTPEHISLIKYRMQRAGEAIKDAKILLDAGHAHSATNRIYYAGFYAVLALLTTKQLGSSKHSGILAIFNQNFVKTGIVPVESGRFFGRIFEKRLKSDYADYFVVNIDEAEQDYKLVCDFVELIDGIIKRILDEN